MKSCDSPPWCGLLQMNSHTKDCFYKMIANYICVIQPCSPCQVAMLQVLEDVGSSSKSCCFAVGRWLDGHSYSAQGYRGGLVCSFMIVFSSLCGVFAPCDAGASCVIQPCSRCYVSTL